MPCTQRFAANWSPLVSCLRVRRLWTGLREQVLDGCLVRFGRGRVESLEPSDGPWDFDFAMPSFVDAHCHLLWLGFETVFADLSWTRSKDDLLDWLSCSHSPPDGEFLRGEKWDDSAWSPEDLPTLEEMDAAFGGGPVFLRRVCGHAALVNSAALSLIGGAGLDPGGPGPLLVERPVLAFDSAFPPGPETLRSALSAAVGRALECGVTAVSTMEPGRHLETYCSAGTGLLRTAISVFREDVEDRLAQAKEAGVSGMKIFLDGAIGARTAAMDEPFDDGSAPLEAEGEGELADLLSGCWRAGLVPAVHAIGGRALRLLDRAGTAALDGAPRREGARIRVEHAEELLAAWPGGWDRGVHLFSMQPNFVARWQQAGGMYESRLGQARARRLNPFGPVRRAGFHLGFGSDGMPFGPLYGLPGAVRHPDPGLGLTMSEALEAYTLGAARISGFHDLAAPLGPGRPADMALLSASPLEAPLNEVAVEGVMASGELMRVNCNRCGGAKP